MLEDLWGEPVLNNGMFLNNVNKCEIYCLPIWIEYMSRITEIRIGLLVAEMKSTCSVSILFFTKQP